MPYNFSEFPFLSRCEINSFIFNSIVNTDCVNQEKDQYSFQSSFGDQFEEVLIEIILTTFISHSLVTDIEVIAIALESLHRWWNWNGHCNRIDILDMQTNSRIWILRWVNNIPMKTNNHVVCWTYVYICHVWLYTHSRICCTCQVGHTVCSVRRSLLLKDKGGHGVEKCNTHIQ